MAADSLNNSGRQDFKVDCRFNEPIQKPLEKSEGDIEVSKANETSFLWPEFDRYHRFIVSSQDDKMIVVNYLQLKHNYIIRTPGKGLKCKLYEEFCKN